MQHLLHLEMIISHEKQIYFALNCLKNAMVLFFKKTIIHSTDHKYNTMNIVYFNICAISKFPTQYNKVAEALLSRELIT